MKEKNFEQEKFLNEFSEKKVSNENLEQAEKKAKNLKDKVADFKLLLKMFKDGTSGKYNISGATLAILGGAILYVVSPIDAIPDFLPLIGWTDDIAVIALVLNKLSGEIEKYKSFNKIQ